MILRIPSHPDGSIRKLILCYMRLSQSFLESDYFQFKDSDQFLRSLSHEISIEERNEIQRLIDLRLPPVTSWVSLATLLGVNTGIIWSFYKKPHKYYREFEIPKGNGKVRKIQAPKIGLKIIQKWLSVRLADKYQSASHVYGFVSGRSHIDAANVHCGCDWVFSVDIQDFFQTTPESFVENAMIEIGYGARSSELIARFACLNGFLAQGSPLSPLLSNMCLRHLDEVLLNLSNNYGVRISRYADDVVFSGVGDFPEGLRNSVVEAFSSTPWKIAKNKIKLSKKPNRLKVHGLLVGASEIRLTKGYRNKLRAYKYLLENGKLKENISIVKGHLNYQDLVDRQRDIFRINKENSII